MPYVNSKESSSSPLIRPLFTPSSSSSSLLPQLISSSSAVAPPVYPPGTMQHPYGTPLFQPFPSLAQPSSLGSVITKEQIHNAFLKLVQVSLSISHFHSFHIYEIVFHQTDLALFHLLFFITIVFLFFFIRMISSLRWCTRNYGTHMIHSRMFKCGILFFIFLYRFFQSRKLQ